MQSVMDCSFGRVRRAVSLPSDTQGKSKRQAKRKEALNKGLKKISCKKQY